MYLLTYLFSELVFFCHDDGCAATAVNDNHYWLSNTCRLKYVLMTLL